MRLFALTVVPAVLLATASLGAGWESGMVEDEGGSVMQAWVQAGNGDVPPELRMMCGDQVNLRYGQGTSLGEGVEPITDPVDFTFDFGDDQVSLPMQYEEMDGMYAGYFEPDAPILGLLRSADTVAVDVPNGPWPVQEFTLQGSSKAIAAVLKSCN